MAVEAFRRLNTCRLGPHQEESSGASPASAGGGFQVANRRGAHHPFWIPQQGYLHLVEASKTVLRWARQEGLLVGAIILQEADEESEV